MVNELTVMVEAYGAKGLKGKAWRKVFRSVEAMLAWAEKHDAEIIGTREVSRDEALASGYRVVR